MTRPVQQPRMQRLVTVIASNEEKDATARAHTRTNALASDSDRIEAARIAAEKLQRRISVHSDLDSGVFGIGRRWEHYCDSVGGIQSVCPEQVPS